MQGARRRHAGHTGATDSTELNPRHIVAEGRWLQAGLHHLQWTSQYGSDCPPTSGRKIRADVGGDTTKRWKTKTRSNLPSLILATIKIMNCKWCSLGNFNNPRHDADGEQIAREKFFVVGLKTKAPVQHHNTLYSQIYALFYRLKNEIPTMTTNACALVKLWAELWEPSNNLGYFCTWITENMCTNMHY